MDGEVGLSFKGQSIFNFSSLFLAFFSKKYVSIGFLLENFHFALVGHLIKGFRHNSATTRSRTTRVLTFLLSIIAKPYKRDKFEVTTDSVAYLTGLSFVVLTVGIYIQNSVEKLIHFYLLFLAALVAVSEEVRSRCRLRHVENNFENTDSFFQKVSKEKTDSVSTCTLLFFCHFLQNVITYGVNILRIRV